MEIEGVTLGETRRPILLFETGLPTRSVKYGCARAPMASRRHPTLPFAKSICRPYRTANSWFLSSDPAMRGWIADTSTYWPRIEVGDTMRAFSVGDVVESRNPAYAVGDKVMGIFGWQDYAAVKQPQVMRKVLEGDLPLSLSLGVLGLNGLTAYFGLLDVCRPKAGETIVVSTAAGGVGSAVGQIAKIRGCRAIGFAGGPEKVSQCVEDFGYDSAIDYKVEKDLDGALARHCPEGIDAFFDNTSGAVHDAVLRRINLGARIAICGTASYASWDLGMRGRAPSGISSSSARSCRAFSRPISRRDMKRR